MRIVGFLSLSKRVIAPLVGMVEPGSKPAKLNQTVWFEYLSLVSMIINLHSLVQKIANVTRVQFEYLTLVRV